MFLRQAAIRGGYDNVNIIPVQYNSLNMEIKVAPSLLEETHSYTHSVMCNDDNELDEDDVLKQGLMEI